MNLSRLIPALLLLSPLAYGQSHFNGVCTSGATQAIVSGYRSTNMLQAVVPSCQVAVFVHGTTTPVTTLYSTYPTTTITNPFTAQTNGLYSFYTDGSQKIDIQVSGNGLVTTTLYDVAGTGGAGGSGITQLTGDVLALGTGATAAQLATVATAGTYVKTVVDAKGRVLSGSTTLAPTDISGLAPSATTDTTNASNIGTGTLSSARLPATISSNTSGNAATATTAITANTATTANALSTTPTPCASGSALVGITSTGNPTSCIAVGSSSGGGTTPITPLVLKGNNSSSSPNPIPVVPKVDLPYPGTSANQLATTTNNGIGNAISAAGTNGNAIIESSYTGTDGEAPSIYSVSNLLSSGQQLHSYRNGIDWEQHYNSSLSGGNSTYVSSLRNYLRDTPSANGVEGHYGMMWNYTSAGPGTNYGYGRFGQNGWTTNQALTLNSNMFTRGISNALTINSTCYKIGDCGGIYIYHYGVGGFHAGSDEGHQLFKMDGGELTKVLYSPIVYVSGSIVSIDKNQGNPSDGLPLVKTNVSTYTGHMTAMTTPGTESPGLLTVDTTLAAPTFAGSLSADVTISPNPQAGISTTFAITTTTGNPVTTKNLILFCDGEIEESPVTAASTTSITALLRYSHPSGCKIYQNTTGILYLDMTADQHTTTGGSLYRSAIPVIPVDTTHLAYRQNIQGSAAQNRITDYIHSFDTSSRALFTTHPGAEVCNVHQNNGNPDGGTTVCPNQAAFTTSDSIYQPHGQTIVQNGIGVDMNFDSPTSVANNRGIFVAVHGGGVQSYNFDGILIDNQSTPSQYFGHGGYLQAPVGLHYRGTWGNLFYSYETPDGNGNQAQVIHIGPPSVSGQNTAYDLWNLSNTYMTGHVDLTAGTFNITGPSTAFLQENGSPVCTAANSASTSGCGTGSGGSGSTTIGTVTNSGSTGTFTNSGTSTNPVLNINFPVASGSAGVSSFNTRTGAVTLTSTDVNNAYSTDTVNNTALGFRTGSGGDSTVPAPASGVSYIAQKGGVLQMSINGGAYAPIPTTSGGGSGGQLTGENAVTSSTTALSISVALNTVTLAANYTYTLAAGSAGQHMTLGFCQNSTGGFTVTPPANVTGSFTPGTTASKCSFQDYVYSTSLSQWKATNQGIINE